MIVSRVKYGLVAGIVLSLSACSTTVPGTPTTSSPLSPTEFLAAAAVQCAQITNMYLYNKPEYLQARSAAFDAFLQAYEGEQIDPAAAEQFRLVAVELEIVYRTLTQLRSTDPAQQRLWTDLIAYPKDRADEARSRADSIDAGKGFEPTTLGLPSDILDELGLGQTDCRYIGLELVPTQPLYPDSPLLADSDPEEPLGPRAFREAIALSCTAEANRLGTVVDWERIRESSVQALVVSKTNAAPEDAAGLLRDLNSLSAEYLTTAEALGKVSAADPADQQAWNAVIDRFTGGSALALQRAAWIEAGEYDLIVPDTDYGPESEDLELLLINDRDCARLISG